MKKLLFYLILLTGMPALAQNDFVQIKEALQQQYPSLNLENKIIIVNTWSGSDIESRDFNAELNRTVSVYEFAKLRGGKNGIIGVTIYDGKEQSSGVVSNNSGSTKLLQLSTIKLKDKNVVYNSAGEVIYKSLPAKEIFESVHKLVTR